jgi:chromobox protein 5
MPSIADPSGAHEDDVTLVDSDDNALGLGSPGMSARDDAVTSDALDDEYEIERIVSHSSEDTDGQLSYFVKWKGYPDTENTWVVESDMGGAQEMISEYWADLPESVLHRARRGKKKRQSMTPQPSKRARREPSVPTRRNKRTNGQVARSVSPDDEGLDDEDAQLERIRSDPSLGLGPHRTPHRGRRKDERQQDPRLYPL